MSAGYNAVGISQGGLLLRWAPHRPSQYPLCAAGAWPSAVATADGAAIEEIAAHESISRVRCIQLPAAGELPIWLEPARR